MKYQSVGMNAPRVIAEKNKKGWKNKDKKKTNVENKKGKEYVGRIRKKEKEKGREKTEKI